VPSRAITEYGFGGYRVVYTIIRNRVCVVILAAGKRNEGNVDNIYAWLTDKVLEARLAPVLRKLEEEDHRDPEPE
jgi:hypothetical protein